MLTGIRPRVRGRVRATDGVQGPGFTAKALVCGQVLRTLRERAGIGLEDFAELAKVSRPSVSKLEAGRTMLAVHHLDLYAEVINASGRHRDGEHRLTGVEIFALIEEECDKRRARGGEVDWREGVIVAKRPPDADGAAG